jgi:hypothetical protein
MNARIFTASATLAAFLGASVAMAETWLPPKEIQPKAEGSATPAATPQQPQAAPAKATEAPKNKEAKTKDCKAQSAAKGLHGPERKKFIESCKNS